MKPQAKTVQINTLNCLISAEDVQVLPLKKPDMTRKRGNKVQGIFRKNMHRLARYRSFPVKGLRLLSEF